MGKKSSTKRGSKTAPQGVLQLVQAFLQEHASSKLAAKMASYFPEQLSERADNAEARANALVRTLEAQLDEEDSPVYKALQSSETKLSEKKKRKASDEATAEMPEESSAAEGATPEAVEVAQVEQTTPASTSEVPSEATVVEQVGPTKKRKGKTQPTERFQRVKSDQAVYADDRLRDMSYEAKSGAGDWGARAHADLIVVKGKNFTKEKNKKKRGSYRGGTIDQGSHSIKFTYDDE